VADESDASDHVSDPDEYHRANRSNYQGANSAVGSGNIKRAEEPSADDAADKAEHEIANDPKASAAHQFAGEPSGQNSDYDRT
jgi:hypothetical protein